MAQVHTSKQPQDIKNNVERVAIVGAGGRVGKYIVEAMVKNGKHQVTAITRADSTSILTTGVRVKKVNYDDQGSLVEALHGQDALIITMGVTAPPEQQTKLIEAAAEANVPWILPNEWGVDSANVELSKDNLLVGRQAKYREHMEQLGKSSWIGVTCSFWYEFSLAGGTERYGFDLKDRTVTFFDDGNTRINTTTWPQCGRAVANLLSLKISPDNENDGSPCLEQFRNNRVYISSFLASQRDMLDSVMRVSGTTTKDWKVDYESSKERYKSGMEEFQKGNLVGFAKLLYSRLFFPGGGGNYETSKGLHNDVLGLPREDIDEATRIALQTVEQQG